MLWFNILVMSWTGKSSQAIVIHICSCNAISGYQRHKCFLLFSHSVIFFYSSLWYAVCIVVIATGDKESVEEPTIESQDQRFQLAEGNS